MGRSDNTSSSCNNSPGMCKQDTSRSSYSSKGNSSKGMYKLDKTRSSYSNMYMLDKAHSHNILHVDDHMDDQLQPLSLPAFPLSERLTPV